MLFGKAGNAKTDGRLQVDFQGYGGMKAIFRQAPLFVWNQSVEESTVQIAEVFNSGSFAVGIVMVIHGVNLHRK